MAATSEIKTYRSSYGWAPEAEKKIKKSQTITLPTPDANTANLKYDCWCFYWNAVVVLYQV